MKKILIPKMSTDHYKKLEGIAKKEQRPIGRQAKVIIENYLEKIFDEGGYPHNQKENAK